MKLTSWTKRSVGATLVVGVILCFAILRFSSWDLDGDGSRDSVAIGSLNLHALCTGPAASSSRTLVEGVDANVRLYDVPSAYAKTIVEMAFHNSEKWDIAKNIGIGSIDVRRRDNQRSVSVSVGEWRDWTLVRLSIDHFGPDPGRDLEPIDDAFQTIEALLFYGQPTRKAVSGFNP